MKSRKNLKSRHKLLIGHVFADLPPLRQGLRQTCALHRILTLDEDMTCVLDYASA